VAKNCVRQERPSPKPSQRLQVGWSVLKGDISFKYGQFNSQWIGLRANLQESLIFHGKIYGFLMFPVDCPLEQSIFIGEMAI
jgi:hypothetical protein